MKASLEIVRIETKDIVTTSGSCAVATPSGKDCTFDF